MMFVLLGGCALVLSAVPAMLADWPSLHQVPQWLVVRDGPMSLRLALAVPILYVSFCAGAAMYAVRAHDARGLRRQALDEALDRYQLLSTVARVVLLASFGAVLFFTNWVRYALLDGGLVHWPLLASLTVLAPFVLAILCGWVVQWPADRLLRETINVDLVASGRAPRQAWTFRAYMVHHLRQNLLFVLVPMCLIMFASDLRPLIGPALRQVTVELPFLDRPVQLWWLDNAPIGLASVLVLVFMPLLIRWLWITTPLPPGPLRQRLEQIAAAHGVRYRDILLWDPGGGLVNAAVIGLVGRLRYVLLSEGLIQDMKPLQVEGVFGHELGHLVHHHLLRLVLFCVATMVVVDGVFQAAQWLSFWAVPQRVALTLVVGLGLPGTLPEWGRQIHAWTAADGPWSELASLGLIVALGGAFFGRISRLFERQADLFGAQQIDLPAERSGEAGPPRAAGGPVPLLAAGLVGPPAGPRRAAPDAPVLTRTGAQRFGSALDLVAYLNGMDPHHFDWRHGSIRERMDHLLRLADDPAYAATFQAQVRRANRILWVAAIVAVLASGAYYTLVTLLR